jgi:signal transduction histidine kinase
LCIFKHVISPGAAYPLGIVVIDSGPGIAAHRQEEIFLLDTSGRKEGHGLGLYISRSLMETMGGRLSLADSVMFLGSAFIIALSEFPTEGVDNG